MGPCRVPSSGLPHSYRGFQFRPRYLRIVAVPLGLILLVPSTVAARPVTSGRMAAPPLMSAYPDTMAASCVTCVDVRTGSPSQLHGCRVLSNGSLIWTRSRRVSLLHPENASQLRLGKT